jgi:hypothetical protein
MEKKIESYVSKTLEMVVYYEARINRVKRKFLGVDGYRMTKVFEILLKFGKSNFEGYFEGKIIGLNNRFWGMMTLMIVVDLF